MGNSNKMFQILVIGTIAALASSSSLPGWQDLNCEKGHKYLFSDVQHNWQDARDECELYGGWLVSIKDLHEQNCLLEHAQSSVQYGWFWHDANDAAVEGKFVHAYDNSELSWMNHLWYCNNGNDYLILGLHGETNGATGAWCNEPATYTAYFIC